MVGGLILDRAVDIPVDEAAGEIEETFCCRCQEEFPIAQEPAVWRMGAMRLLAYAPMAIREQFKDWLTHPNGKYLCGNCYFDLTDESGSD